MFNRKISHIYFPTSPSARTLWAILGRPYKPTIPTNFFDFLKKFKKKLRNRKVAHIFATD